MTVEKFCDELEEIRSYSKRVPHGESVTIRWDLYDTMLQIIRRQQEGLDRIVRWYDPDEPGYSTAQTLQELAKEALADCGRIASGEGK